VTSFSILRILLAEAAGAYSNDVNVNTESRLLQHRLKAITEVPRGSGITTRRISISLDAN